MFTRMTWLFHKVIVIQMINAPSLNLTRPSLDAFRLSGRHQQGSSRHHQKAKSHICNILTNVVSFYHKFLRTHHARGACYHFVTEISFASKMQCATPRVYIKCTIRRNIFKTPTSMNIARDHHNNIVHQFVEP